MTPPLRDSEGLLPTATDWLRAAELIEAKAQGDVEGQYNLLTAAMDSTPPRVVALLQAVLHLACVDAKRAARIRQGVEADHRELGVVIP
jgi:hypothetical protein